MRRTAKVTQSESASTWLHLVDDGYTDIMVLSVFSSDGEDTINPDTYSWDVVDLMIKIDFGLESHSGYFVYEYDDGTDSQTISSGANNVTINVTQSGGACSGCDSFRG